MDTEQTFILRSYSGEQLDNAPDIVTANRRSREFSQHTKVYRQDPEEEEMLMSYTGPRDPYLK